MTSGFFHSITIDSIFVNREARQRRELKGIQDLANSIKINGLINPLLVTREGHTLIAGERRLAAAKLLGWTHITCQFQDEVPDLQLRILELEENVRRADLTWQERCLAVENYHKAQQANDSAWSAPKTAEALNLSVAYINKELAVANAVSKNPEVAAMSKFSLAHNFVKRQEERGVIEGEKLIEAAIGEQPQVAKCIINTSFLDWAPTYDGEPFNLIHCDFPYGVNREKSGYSAASVILQGGYEDSENTYWELLQCLASNIDRIAAPQCHLMFWFSMKFYIPTVQFLREQTDFIIDNFPFIWHKSDNSGVLPDHQRGARRTYETALFGYRGDRKIVSAVANSIAAPLGPVTHISQKPLPVLSHFFRMLVDSSTRLLDPTCGSGTALRAAEALGAKEVLGLEIDKDFAEKANDELERERKMRTEEIEV